MQDILLITPPFTQLNTPYPATAYIKGFLNTKEIDAFQMDLGIEVILNIFSKTGLAKIFEKVSDKISTKSENAQRIFTFRERYTHSIDQVVLFLQGKNETLARKICSDVFLPKAARFEQLDDLEWAFGNMGMQDKAKHLSTLYLEDLSDFIVECVDNNFGFSRYAERLGRSANSFDELHQNLQDSNTYIDEITLTILEKTLKVINPKLICFSVPFPGNLYSAFRCAQYIKQHHPEMKVAMGGGFPNTELRSISDPRVFEYFDFISLDDGELPLELIISNVLNPTASNPNFNFLKRTFVLDKGKVIYNNFSFRTDYKQEQIGTPDYSDLLLDKYISVIEIANPMHSLWSDGRWNKLTMAHGCYWGKCTFCDVSLDYIKNYEPVTAGMLVDRMEAIIKQTNERGFHFVDEAAPPALMREVALEILRRDLVVTWWTNIRFEKSFNFDLCRLLAASGCIAVSGGLEVASDRLLELIKKGVTVAQVAQVTRNFTESGIMVHAYLMYGYPTQTVQETIDSLEMVRQLFDAEVLQSGFWHQFALTAHSPIGLNPKEYKIEPQLAEISFANNDVQFIDETGIDHDQFSYGLKKSLFNFMHGNCLDHPLENWFDFEIPKTTIANSFIEEALTQEAFQQVKPSTKLIWIGAEPTILKDNTGEDVLVLYTSEGSIELVMDEALANWLKAALIDHQSSNKTTKTYQDMKASFERQFEDFTLFWYSEEMALTKEAGLLLI